MPEQEVPFRMEGGRVWHERMTFRIRDIPLRTTGWVALNQQLSITAELPIQERWLGNNRWLSSLKDQTLSIPIHGTCSSRNWTRGVMSNLNRQFVTGTAENLLQQEMQKQLQRILPSLTADASDRARPERHRGRGSRPCRGSGRATESDPCAPNHIDVMGRNYRFRTVGPPAAARRPSPENGLTATESPSSPVTISAAQNGTNVAKPESNRCVHHRVLRGIH